MRMRLLSSFSVSLVALSLLSGLAFGENTDKEADEALAAYRKTASSKEESDRISGIEALAAIQNKRVVDALAGPLQHDKSPAVRRAAAKVIGAQWSQNAASTLVKALNPDDPAKDVTTAIILALGQTESDVAVPALVSLLTVKPKARAGAAGAGAGASGQPAEDPAVFTGPALDALRKIGSAKAAEDLVNFLNRESAAQGGGRGGRRGGGGNNGGGQGGDPLSKEAEAALKSITGQSFTTAADWRKWWNDRKDELKTIPVYRCTGTGKTFDKPDSKTKCPADGDQHPSCGYLLKTRFEGGGLSAPDATPDKPEKKGKKPAN